MTKLLVLNFMIFIVFGIIIGVMVLSFGNIEEILSRLTDQNVSRIVHNARCAQRVSRVFSETSLLLSTFYRNPDLFEKQAGFLLREAEVLLSADDMPEFSETLTGFCNRLIPLFAQCRQINEKAESVTRIHEKLIRGITEMEEIISEKMIACILKNESATVSEQIGVLLLSHRETLYRVNLEFSRLRPLLPCTDDVERIAEILSRLELRMQSLPASGPDISEYSHHLIDGIGEYRDTLVELNTHMIEFRSLHAQFRSGREKAEQIILKTDSYIISSTEEMKKRTGLLIRSSLYFVFSLSGAAVIFLAIFTYMILLRNIRLPMKAVCRGIAAIGGGKLDTRICLHRQDEWRLIEDAFNRMAADISNSHETLCEKNRELEKMHHELEISLHRLREETVQREDAERKKEELRQKLIHAQKMEAMGTLAGGIAHDFNNLLQGIQGYAELMLMGLPREHPHYPKLEEIVRSTQRGGISVSRLRAFAGQEPGNAVRINLNAKIRDIKTILERSFPKSVQIQLNLDENLHIIEADAFQMDQMLINLGINARDAMPCGGYLCFETLNSSSGENRDAGIWSGRQGEFVIIRIKDTGTGMDRETLAHIFDPFYTTREFGRGTGLGLSTVFGIVQQYRGIITCHSEPGKGTCFTICLPVTDEKTQT